MWGNLVRSAVVLLLLASLPGIAEEFGDLRNLSDDHTDSHFVAAHYRTVAEWEQKKAWIRRQLLTAAGLNPLPDRTPLDLRRSTSTAFGDFTVEVVSYQPFPGLRIAANIYRPTRVRGRRPAVLVSHGHWKHGRIHDDEEYSVPKLCANLAMQGYVALSYDMLGYNESRQLPHKFGNSTEETRWNFHPLGLQLWNSIRALDLLQSLPYVDGQRLAVTGASGGGTETILLSAVDDRVKAAAPVVMVSASFQGDDACEMAPGLRVGTNNVEIAAMMAPRPLLLVSSTKDWTKNTPEVEYPAVRGVYQLYGAADRAGFHHVDFKHNYNRESREAVYAFLRRHLRRMPNNPAPLERPVPTLPEKALLWPKPFTEENGYASRDLIFESWKQAARAQANAATDDALRDRIRAVIGMEGHDPIQALRVPEWLLLQRQGHGERIPARWLPGKAANTAVIVTKAGAASDEHQKLLEPYRAQNWNVLSIDPYQSGHAVARRNPPRKDHYVFHDSDDAYRIQDIVTAVRYAATPSPEPPVLVCDKGASAWCLAAAAVVPVPVKLALAEEPAEDSFKDRLFLPGLERVGGFPALLRLANQPRSISQAGRK